MQVRYSYLHSEMQLIETLLSQAHEVSLQKMGGGMARQKTVLLFTSSGKNPFVSGALL